MKVWQIATGEAGRDYRELYFNHDLMIMGPGHLGDARCKKPTDNIWKYPDGSRVRAFAYEVDPGNRILMRFGQEVIGVGEIPSETDHQYSFDFAFRSVYGWDLRHCRRVKWAADSVLSDVARAFKGKRMSKRFTRVHDRDIVAAVYNLDASHFAAPPEKLPSVDADCYTDDELRDELSRKGASNSDSIVAALKRAKRLISWYRSDSSGRDPREYEIVSHITLPLFLGLGWSYEQIAVEWNRADMAFFKRTPTTRENCVVVLEAKGLGRGLSEVLQQPKDYVHELGLEDVRYILTSNGANLFIYEKSGVGWNSSPVGYLDVMSLQKEYVLPKYTNKDTDLVSTLVRLQPSAI